MAPILFITSALLQNYNYRLLVTTDYSAQGSLRSIFLAIPIGFRFFGLVGEVAAVAGYFGLSVGEFLALAGEGEVAAGGGDRRELLCEAGCEEGVVFEPAAYDRAIIGCTTDCRAVYSYELLVGCLVEEGLTADEAAEYVDFNFVAALPYMGDHAPVIFYRF